MVILYMICLLEECIRVEEKETGGKVNRTGTKVRERERERERDLWGRERGVEKWCSSLNGYHKDAARLSLKSTETF